LGLWSPADTEKQGDACVIVLQQGWRKVDIVEIDLKCRLETKIAMGLILQRQADWDQPTGVVAIDATRTCSFVEVHADQSDSRIGDEIDPIGESDMVPANARDGNLEEIAHRTDLHHRTNGEFRIRIVI